MLFYTFFPELLNMSLTASVVIVFVLLLRLLIKKAPKVISYALWGIVLIRLLCPVSIESNFSLFGLINIPVEEHGILTSSIEYIPNDIVHTEYPTVVLPVSDANGIRNDVAQNEEQLSADPLERLIFFATYAWIAGVLGMVIYTVVSYVRLRRKLFTAICLRDNIWSADGITSPFVIGLFRPKIYLPSSMEIGEQTYIILHEQHHIRRLDHIWKILSFATLCIHWFNPLVWVAFVMASKDMEMSCDEAVVKKMGEGVLADYTASLLSFATGKHVIAGMPLAFGEGDTKGRIHNLASWKKPTLWIVLTATIICALLAVVLLTNPSNDELYAPEPFGHSYKVEEILYSDPQYSFSYSKDTAPKYQFTSDYVMFVSENGFSQDGSIEWLDQKGGFEEVKITTENFDNYFNMSCFQISNNSWSKFRTDIKRAWRIDIENDKNNVFYYLISTKSGEVYLTYGYHDPESETDPHSDDTSIRWLFKLTVEDDDSVSFVQEWFDYLYSDKMPWNGRQEINLEAFPDVTFRWMPEKIEAIVGDEIKPLYTGMPIWNVFFTDLTGDGLPELCSTLSMGSGMIDNRIIIYDYANSVSYELEERGNYDYVLSLQDERLIVTKQVHNSQEIVETGYLTYVDETLTIIPN